MLKLFSSPGRTGGLFSRLKAAKKAPEAYASGAFSVFMLFFEPYLPMQRNRKVTI